MPDPTRSRVRPSCSSTRASACSRAGRCSSSARRSARPLLEEIVRLVAERGAYALLRVTPGRHRPRRHHVWLRARSAGAARAAGAARPARVRAGRRADRRRRAGEHARPLLAVDTERLRALPGRASARRSSALFTARAAVGRLPVPDAGARAGRRACRPTSSPTSSTAPCLLDWDAERERMQRYADRFDAAEQVRIVGAGTDLTLSIAGPRDEGRRRRRQHARRRVLLLPGRGLRRGRDHVRRVSRRSTPAGTSPASACASRAAASSTPPPSANEEFLLEMLDTDEGARRARRARHRLQPGHHALHEEHALRREDRRHRPPRARQRHPRHRRHERVRDPLGHRQGPARRAAGSSSTARSCSENGAWLI